VIVAQHAEEAAMLWLLRRAAVRAPHYSLADLAKLDGRLEAHLDGLRIAGGHGWTTCLEQLSFREEGEVFVGGVLAFESQDPGRMDAVLPIVEENPELASGLVSALGWIDAAVADAICDQLLASDSPTQRLAGIAGRAIRRRDPGRDLDRALRHENARLRARAARAAGELQRGDCANQLADLLTDNDPTVRFEAARSLALLKPEPAALEVLHEMALNRGPWSSPALQTLMRRLPPADAKAWQQRLATTLPESRAAVEAAGIFGDPESIPWLIERMRLPELARLAGEAFTTITGAGIAYRDLEGAWPEGYQAGPTESPEDDHVEPDPDENLPWPHPGLVASWWEKNRTLFAPGTRHICGKPMTAEWLTVVLRDGFQRQRAAAALELALRPPGSTCFNVRAPGSRQMELLGRPADPLR
jgi:uncharacterized protein (TIGR02270 family)